MLPNIFLRCNIRNLAPLMLGNLGESGIERGRHLMSNCDMKLQCYETMYHSIIDVKRLMYRGIMYL